MIRFSRLLEARIDGERMPRAMAVLLPYEGPNYAGLVDSRRRWLAGETVTPTGLAVGAIALRKDIRAELTETLRHFEFVELHNGGEDIYTDIDEDLGEHAENTRLIHSLVRDMALLDARRRGLDNPDTDRSHTFGGKTTLYDGAQRLHIDDEHFEGVVLRYLATAIGDPTGLKTEPVSIRDIEENGYLRPELATDLAAPKSRPDGLIDITLMELHTPHYRPPLDGESRLFSSLDVVPAGVDYYGL